jgi:hypothetical protein
MEVVVNEKAERLDHLGFPQDRGGYDYFLQRIEGYPRNTKPQKQCLTLVYMAISDKIVNEFTLSIMEILCVQIYEFADIKKGIFIVIQSTIRSLLCKALCW